MLQQATLIPRGASVADPWTIKLGALRGIEGADGIQRVSTAAVFEVLEVPLERRPQPTRRLAKVIRDLDWGSLLIGVMASVFRSLSLLVSCYLEF